MVPAIATIGSSGDDNPVPVLAVLGVIVIWRYAIKGKGNPAARLAALLSAVIVALIAVSMVNPHSAGIASSGCLPQFHGNTEW